MAKKRDVVEAGSGNVFEDLGFADAGERRQAKAAKRLVIPQPHVSELANYKLSRFSSERLMHFITLLDHVRAAARLSHCCKSKTCTARFSVSLASPYRFLSRITPELTRAEREAFNAGRINQR